MGSFIWGDVLKENTSLFPEGSWPKNKGGWGVGVKETMDP